MAPLCDRARRSHSLRRLAAREQIFISARLDEHEQFFPASQVEKQPSGKEDEQFSARARFFNEARAVNRIDHPSLVQVSDYGQLPDGMAYIVMEYLKGETLGQRLKRINGKLPTTDVIRFGRQICTGLAAAHEKEIVHREQLSRRGR